MRINNALLMNPGKWNDVNYSKKELEKALQKNRLEESKSKSFLISRIMK